MSQFHLSFFGRETKLRDSYRYEQMFDLQSSLREINGLGNSKRRSINYYDSLHGHQRGEHFSFCCLPATVLKIKMCFYAVRLFYAGSIKRGILTIYYTQF